MTDEELMQAYAEGDYSAFHSLYERHKRRILGYLMGKLRDRDEAEEVFQKVFFKLHRARSGYRQDVPFLPWVFIIARNAVIDHLRERQTRQTHVTLSEEVVAAYPAPPKEHSSFGVDLSALSSLNETQRRALELRFDQGFTFGEIAERLQLSPDNARQIVSRAIGKLRRLMAGKEARHE